MNLKAETRPPRRRVHAIGAYGFENFGDELFVTTVRENAAQLWPDSTVRTFVIPSRQYASSTLLGRFMRLGAAIIGFAWGDTIAMCGGSTLEDVNGVDRIRQRFLKYRSVEALGVSVGPFSSNISRERVEKTIKYVNRIIVRDAASIERLREFQTRTSILLGGDLVALSSKVKPRISRARKTITICPSAAASVPEETLKQLVLDAVDTYIDRVAGDPKVILLALSNHPSSNDLPLCEFLRDALDDHGIEAQTKSFKDLGLDATCSVISQSSMVWSYRLHGAIVAYLSEVPFFIIGHHAKCVDFSSDIEAPASTVLPLSSSWNHAVITLLNGEKPRFSPDDYRSRARRVYLKETAPDIVENK